ncbi:MAG: NAD(P)-dependent oxidoreductase [Verrucomicrobia bacterium]|nr:NAD(P)-dependent oxidoreductase [Verrucomicrobiota bacterium]
MKILITGAAGFIGSHLARLLVQQGHEVHATLLDANDTDRIRDLLPRLHTVLCNLEHPAEVDACLASVRPELCIHLAWYAVPGKYLNAVENFGSLEATLHLARKLAALGCRRFVGIGTCFEYEHGGSVLGESSPTKPVSLYAACKLSTALVLEQFARLTPMQIAWVRLFYQYGPDEAPQRLMPHVINSLLQGRKVELTPGEQVRDFLHIEDVASGIAAVAHSGLNGIVNVGSGQRVTVREIAEKIAAIVSRPDLLAIGARPYAPNDPMFILADNSRLRQNTNWRPRYDLDAGLRQTVEWWKARLPG